MLSSFSSSKVSIIVAAYNAQDTLKKCIESIQKQTHDELEILIINDCSQDNTLQIANSLSEQDPRIIVVDQAKNGGPGVARNAGLEKASGEWITIVDADDTISPNRIELLLGAAYKNECDIVCDNMQSVAINSDTAKPYIPLNSDIFGKIDFADYIRRHSRRHPTPNPGFLKPFIRRTLLDKNQIRYQTDVPVGEDSLLIYDLFVAGASTLILPDIAYTYYKYEDSISAVFSPQKVRSLYLAYERFLSKHAMALSLEVKQSLNKVLKELKSVEKVEKFRADGSMTNALSVALDPISILLMFKMALAKLKK